MQLNRIRTLISQPVESLSWLKRNTYAIGRRIKQGHFKETLDGLAGLFFGWTRYIEYLKQQSEDGFVIRRVGNNKMALDLSDPGISQSLLIHGIREIKSTRVYRQELRRLAKTTDEVTVLEIGANIGYYALIEAEILESQGKIYAFEPSPGNVSILKRNICLNDYGEHITVNPVAVGSEEGTSTLMLSDKSNTHSIDTHAPNREIRDSIQVRRVNPVDYLIDQDISPSSVNIIRMDIEGYEFELFSTLKPIFEGDQPLLIFIEIHANKVAQKEVDDLLAFLDSDDLEIISVDSYYQGPVEVDSIGELDQFDNIELILRRGY